MSHLAQFMFTRFPTLALTGGGSIFPKKGPWIGGDKRAGTWTAGGLLRSARNGRVTKWSGFAAVVEQAVDEYAGGAELGDFKVFKQTAGQAAQQQQQQHTDKTPRDHNIHVEEY